jgi:hypothetical protein
LGKNKRSEPVKKKAVITKAQPNAVFPLKAKAKPIVNGFFANNAKPTGPISWSIGSSSYKPQVNPEGSRNVANPL